MSKKKPQEVKKSQINRDPVPAQKYSKNSAYINLAFGLICLVFAVLLVIKARYSQALLAGVFSAMALYSFYIMYTDAKK